MLVRAIGPRDSSGTVAHDHGGALVRALTGVDTDRLPEEKARGITIELGFAPLELGDGLRLSVVDVPGHEGLVRTMVAGATGIDLVLLVVAADEGVMPQTREHLAICELLDLAQAWSRSQTDLAAPELAELAAEEIGRWPPGSRGAPVVPALRRPARARELRDAPVARRSGAAPRTPRSGPRGCDRPRLRGEGVRHDVTGTLLGALAVGAAVEIFPAGLRARVRGVQSHSEKREHGEPGSRCALNLQGAPLAQLARGQIVSTPGALAPAGALDVSLVWLGTAPRAEGPVSVELSPPPASGVRGWRRSLGELVPADAASRDPRGGARRCCGDRFIVRGLRAASPRGRRWAAA
jgi:selenocysteine-specific elongation factor